MKIIIAGGSGQVGTVLARDFTRTGDEVIVLTRKPQLAPWRTVEWDGRSIGPWAAELERSDAVVNLAGRSVNCRYTEEHRREILESRVKSTRAIGVAIARLARPPKLWLQASTATIYAHRFDAPNDESTGIINRDHWPFSIEVAQAWEREIDQAVVVGTRKIKMRSALILSPNHGGIFDTLRRLVRLGAGGAAGDGRQFVSWIHHTDFVRAVRWLIEHREISGAVNIAAPDPLPNAEFMRVLRTACGVPFGIPARGPLLDLGALLMRTEPELVLKSRRVVPGRLLSAGFRFEFPSWPEAAADLCAGSHERRQW